MSKRQKITDLISYIYAGISVRDARVTSLCKHPKVTDLISKPEIISCQQEECQDICFHTLSPLHVAVSMRRSSFVLELLIAGANINCVEITPDGKRATPLHLAVADRSQEMTQLLLEHGASPDIKGSNSLWNYKGKTPLESAKICNSPKCAEMIQKFQKKQAAAASRNKKPLSFLELGTQLRQEQVQLEFENLRFYEQQLNKSRKLKIKLNKESRQLKARRDEWVKLSNDLRVIQYSISELNRKELQLKNTEQTKPKFGTIRKLLKTRTPFKSDEEAYRLIDGAADTAKSVQRQLKAKQEEEKSCMDKIKRLQIQGCRNKDIQLMEKVLKNINRDLDQVSLVCNKMERDSLGCAICMENLRKRKMFECRNCSQLFCHVCKRQMKPICPSCQTDLYERPLVRNLILEDLTAIPE